MVALVPLQSETQWPMVKERLEHVIGVERFGLAWHTPPAMDQIKELGVPLIMGAGIGAAPRSITRRVEQRILLDAGVPIALVPGSALPNGEQFRFRLSELVRHGLRADEVLRAVTLTPAEILGIQARCGSLEAGKDADILLFSGDPLEPTSELVEVLVGGETVYRRGEGNK